MVFHKIKAWGENVGRKIKEHGERFIHTAGSKLGAYAEKRGENIARKVTKIGLKEIGHFGRTGKVHGADHFVREGSKLVKGEVDRTQKDIGRVKGHIQNKIRKEAGKFAEKHGEKRGEKRKERGNTELHVWGGDKSMGHNRKKKQKVE